MVVDDIGMPSLIEELAKDRGNINNNNNNSSMNMMLMTRNNMRDLSADHHMRATVGNEQLNISNANAEVNLLGNGPQSRNQNV